MDQQDEFAARFNLDRLLALRPAEKSLRELRARLELDPGGLAKGTWALANQSAEARSRIPPQADEAPPNLIDLSDYYTNPLTESPITDAPSETYNLSSLPRGIQTFGGVRFDVRGWVRLLGSYGEMGHFAARESIPDIRIDRLCPRLHFLHGTGWVEDQGKTIARYVIHYADGQQSELPVRYGLDVQNFVWLTPSEPEEPEGVVRVWTGTNALSAQAAGRFRLYKSVWENPRPDVPVVCVDFVSLPTLCHPFLIAITTE